DARQLLQRQHLHIVSKRERLLATEDGQPLAKGVGTRMEAPAVVTGGLPDLGRQRSAAGAAPGPIDRRVQVDSPAHREGAVAQPRAPGGLTRRDEGDRFHCRGESVARNGLGSRRARSLRVGLEYSPPRLEKVAVLPLPRVKTASKESRQLRQHPTHKP